MLHVVCYKERDCQLLKFSMSRGKKRPFAALIILRTLKKNVLTYFQKPKCFHLFITKDSLMGKFEAKPFFQREPPRTAFTEITAKFMLSFFLAY